MIAEDKMGQGIKRKLEDFENDRCPRNQRQSILDISVGKLHVKTIKKVEPPLLRSVLILNTLKHIESELLKEGVQSPTNTSAFTIPEVDPNSTVIDFLPEQNTSSKVEVVSEQSGPLPSIDTFVGSRAMIIDSKEELPGEKLSVSNMGEASPTNLYHSPSFRMEEVFSDFDFPMCDYDMFPAVSNGANLTPLSAEEVLHSFPNAGSNFIGESFTTLSNASLTPFCKGETAFDDLENIMQILVGS
ncbi:uncharacterized protein LOC123535424 isoform X2 [Mercenaria mercenaria]|nr:uncharacterized protein LOC123535424 isoform X2 [Mercenaria mercenaria]